MADYPNVQFSGYNTDASGFTVTVQWNTLDTPGVEDVIVPALYAALKGAPGVVSVHATQNVVATTDVTPA